MKIMKTITLLLSTLFLAGNMFAQTWTWDREPEAGQPVMIQITNVPIEEGELSAVAYYFDGTTLEASDVGIIPTEDPNQVNLSIAIHDHASWVRVVLKNGFQIGSGDQQYVKNAKALPKAGLIEEALASSIYARAMAIEPNDAATLVSFREAVQAYPQWLNEPEVYRAYYVVAKRAEAAEDLAKLKTHVEGIANKPNNTTEAMLVQATRAAKDMADSTLYASMKKTLDKKYPKSIFAQEEMLMTFTKATTPEDRIKIREQFKAKYPVIKENIKFHDQMIATIAQDYSKEEDWTNVKMYVDQINDPMTRARVNNSYAWTLSGESIDAEPINLDIASSLSATSLSLLSTENALPTGVTKKEWATVMEDSRGMYGDTYALILYKQGKYDEAITHQSFSVVNNHFEDGEMNERYVVYLEKAGRTKDLEKFMDQIIVTGKATAKVKEIHKNHWTKTATQDQLYSQYAQQLENQATALRVSNIMKMWESTEAPAFTLKDLSGKQVNLTDYKGKTIVLDFWATWCGPCKASFPGMKKAVEHYASDQSVVFLFVDTWESGDNIQGKVDDFIKSNNYPFHVLMDMEKQVVVDYKVSGIPTKFIIGPDQKIHFTAVGYSGNNDELVEELKTMIQLVKEKTTQQKS
jgi:thiol-disulfide isomerase/thioredoxin